jgi:hypothetical protein
MDKAKRFFDQFIKEFYEGEGYSDELNELFSDYVTENFSLLLVEDHEKRMSAKEMAAHIKKLFGMCEDEKTEKKFLKRLGKAAGVEDCEEKDIKKCADALCKEDDDKCDDVIHELEGMVDYEYEPDSDDDSDDDSDKDSDKDDDSEEKDSDKKKISESLDRGRIVTKGNSQFVVLKDLNDGNVQAALLHHGKPMYRSARLLHAGEYEPTPERINLPRERDQNEEMERKMAARADKSGGFDEFALGH